MMGPDFNSPSSIENAGMESTFTDEAKQSQAVPESLVARFQSKDEIILHVESVKINNTDEAIVSDAKTFVKNKLKKRSDLIEGLLAKTRRHANNSIRKMVSNRCKDLRRKEKTQEKHVTKAGAAIHRQREASQHQQQLRDSSEFERIELLQQVLNCLEEQGVDRGQLDEYVMHIGYDLTFAEIASLRGSTIGAVSGRFYRVQAQIRSTVREFYSEYLSNKETDDV